MFSLPLLTKAIWILLCCIFKHASTTEITELSFRLDEISKIELPVLMCHAKYTGYNKVRWYKDTILLKKGAADESGHILSLVDVLHDPSFSFQQPRELQGYYTCETDYPEPSVVFSYLFRIPTLHTYIGWFISTKDSLEGSDTNLTLEEKILIKKELYSNEMETQLFGFLPLISVLVTDIQVLLNGLEIQYYLYLNRSTIDSHILSPNKLQFDQDTLMYIKNYIRNVSSDVDVNFYYKIIDWTALRGIEIQNLVDSIKSTLGCFEERYSYGNDFDYEIVWPSAYIGEVVVPEDSCSSETRKAVTRLCTGSFTSGASWGNSSRKCFVPLTNQLIILSKNFSNDPLTIYMRKLKNLTKLTDQLTVTALHRISEMIYAISKRNLDSKQDIDLLISIFGDLAKTNRTQLSAAKREIKLSSRLLEVLDNLLKQKSLRLGGSYQIGLNSVSTRAFQADDEKDERVKGMAIHDNYWEVITKDEYRDETTHSFDSRLRSHGFFLLPEDLLTKRETLYPGYECKINTIFFRSWWMFQGPESMLSNQEVFVFPTPVIHVSLTGGPAWNLQDPVKIFFENEFEIEVEHPVCVHYEPRLYDGEGGWSTEGCEFVSLERGFFECHCHHLSTYSIILVNKTLDNSTNESNYGLNAGRSVYSGCGLLTIIALSMIVLMYLL